MIWDVFATRGLGFKASTGDGNISNDQVRSYSIPVAGQVYFRTTDFDNDKHNDSISNPSDGIVNVRISKYFRDCCQV
jgi:hypothetical protein